MSDPRLETFLTLCSLMSYRRTAEALHITQPAVTHHIHDLEERYGCRLFVYDRRTLRLTKQAELLRQYAQSVRYQESRLREQLRGGEARTLRIGATKTIGAYAIAGHLAAFLAEPQNRVSVEVDNTERLLRAIQDGALDFALIEGFFERSRFASRLYRVEPFVGLCGGAHPFAGKTVPLERIWDEHILLREQGSGTRNILENLLAERSHSVSEFRRISTISSFELMTQLLQRTRAISFAYRAVRLHEAALAEFSVEGWDVAREFNYVYLDTPYSAQCVKWFDACRTR